MLTVQGSALSTIIEPSVQLSVQVPLNTLKVFDYLLIRKPGSSVRLYVSRACVFPFNDSMPHSAQRHPRQTRLGGWTTARLVSLGALAMRPANKKNGLTNNVITHMKS